MTRVMLASLNGYVLILLLSAGSVSAADLDWTTVGAAWGFSTLTTIFILFLTLLLQEKCKRKKKEPAEDALNRPDPVRNSMQSNHSNATKVTVISDPRSNSQRSRMRSSGSSGQGQGGEDDLGRRMQRSVSDDSGGKNRRRSDFTSKWCTEHSLSEFVAEALRAHGFTSKATLESLRADDVPTLGLQNFAQECLLRRVLEEKMQPPPESFTRPPRSSSEEVLGSEVSLPLLDRARSQIGMDEVDAQTFAAGLKARHGSTDRSYEVIENGEEASFVVGASSISLRESDSKSSLAMRTYHDSSGQMFNGLLSDKGLYDMAGMLGHEWPHLATLLDVSHAAQEQIKQDYPYSTRTQIFNILKRWRDRCQGEKAEVKGKLHQALTLVCRNDIADRIMKEQVDGSVEKMAFHSIV